jgi:hypothetical protein
MLSNSPPASEGQCDPHTAESSSGAWWSSSASTIRGMSSGTNRTSGRTPDLCQGSLGRLRDEDPPVMKPPDWSKIRWPSDDRRTTTARGGESWARAGTKEMRR